MNSPNLLPMLLQQALQRAHPSPLPSNTVITTITGPYGSAAVATTVAGTTWDESAFVWGGAGVDPGWEWSVSGQWGD